MVIKMKWIARLASKSQGQGVRQKGFQPRARFLGISLNLILEFQTLIWHLTL